MKSLLVSMGFGLAAALYVYFRSVETQAAKAVQTFAGNLFDTSAVFFAGMGLGSPYEAVAEALLGSWVPMTAAGCVAFVAFFMMQIPVGSRPVIDRIWALPSDIIDGDIYPAGKDPISAVGSMSDMIGRKEQLRALSRLTSRPNRQSYAIVEGPEGVGKTRIAVEWLRELSVRDWDTGFMLSGIGSQQVRQTHFRRRTAIVIDDANRRPDLWNIVFELMNQKQKIRVLLVDQFVQSPPNSLPTAVFAILEQRQEMKLRLSRLRLEDMRRITPGLSLPLIERAEGKPLFALLGGDPTHEVKRRSARRLELAETHDKRRLLLLGAFVAPIDQLDRAMFDGTKATLSEMRMLFEGESKAVLRVGIPPITPDILADEIAISIFEEMDHHEFEVFVRTAAKANGLAAQRRIGSLWSRTMIDPERISLRIRAQEILDEEAPELREAMIVIGGHYADVALGFNAPFKELSEALSIVRQLARARPFDAEMRDICLSAHGHSLKSYADAGRWTEFGYVIDAVENLFAENFGIATSLNNEMELGFVSVALQCLREAKNAPIMNRLVAWFTRIMPQNLEAIPIKDASSVLNGICVFLIDAAQRGDDESMERWKPYLQRIVDRPDAVENYEVRVEEASAASVIILAYQEQHRPRKILPWLARIGLIMKNTKFARDRTITECELTSLRNVMTAYGFLGEFTNVEFWGKRMFDKYANYQAHQAPWVPTHLVQAASNVIGTLASAGRYQDVERWASKGVGIVRNMGGRMSVDMISAQVVIVRNATFAYEKTSRSDRIEFWAKLLAPLIAREDARDSLFIRRVEAKTIMGIMNHYSYRSRYSDFCRWGERIVSLSSEDQLKNDGELWETITESAYAGLTVALTFSDQVWRHKWRAIILEAAERFTYHPQIQLYARILGLSVAQFQRRAGA